MWSNGELERTSIGHTFCTSWLEALRPLDSLRLWCYTGVTLVLHCSLALILHKYFLSLEDFISMNEVKMSECTTEVR